MSFIASAVAGIGALGTALGGVGVGGAILGAGALTAGAGVFGSLTAAQTQKNALNAALTQQQQQFSVAQQALNPYIQAGQGALPTLTSLLTPGPSQTQTLSQLPGFQFQSQWGNLAATNALAARGLGGSAGPIGTALSQYNQGLAGTYWQNEVNPLLQYAQLGSGAASALGGQAVQAGGQYGTTLGQIGQAGASGILGATNAVGTGANSIASAALLSQFLGGQNQNQGGGGIYNLGYNLGLPGSGGGVGGSGGGYS
jgi:hypothetical protein